MELQHKYWSFKPLKTLGSEEAKRFFKEFLKAIGAYGANSAIGGFSGYLVEILCIKYGGFLNLVKDVLKMLKFS